MGERKFGLAHHIPYLSSVENYISGWVKGSLVWLVKNSRRLELDRTLACNQATESDHHDDHHDHDQQHTDDDDNDDRDDVEDDVARTVA